MTLYDITRRLDMKLALWPESRPFVHTDDLAISDGDIVNLSSFQMSSHSGTHLDAPYHVLEGGQKVADVPLESLIGPALVIELDGVQEIDVAHLGCADLSQTKRVLIKTSESARPDHVWNEEFPYLTEAAAHYLVDQGTVLVGVDGPSVDPFGTDELRVHKILLGAGAVILENLALADIAAGLYELFALPLKVDADGSPIRAVLKRGLES